MGSEAHGTARPSSGLYQTHDIAYPKRCGIAMRVEEGEREGGGGREGGKEERGVEERGELRGERRGKERRGGEGRGGERGGEERREEEGREKKEEKGHYVRVGTCITGCVTC